MSHRVLLVNESRDSSEFELRTLNLAESLRQRGLPVLVMGASQSPLASWSRAREVPFRACPFLRDLDMESVFKLWRRARRFRPTVVHATTGPALLAVALALALPESGQPRPRLIAESHWGTTVAPTPPLCWAYRQCSAVLANSEGDVRRFAERFGEVTGKVRRVSYSLRPENGDIDGGTSVAPDLLAEAHLTVYRESLA